MKIASGYAEMFEWEDRNPEKEKRVGYTVVVNEQGYIRKATTDDNPNDVIGVVTATATIIGSAAGMEWNKKVLVHTACYTRAVLPVGFGIGLDVE